MFDPRNFLTAIIVVFAGAKLAACGTDLGPVDAGEDVASDTTPDDQGLGPKADGVEDMGTAEVPVVDMGTPVDSSMMPDAEDVVTCSTGPRDGICLHVDDCGAGAESVPGFCPGTSEIQCCVLVEEGVCQEAPSVENMPQPNAGLSEAPGDPGCPSGMARIDGFCIDLYEAALMEVLADGSERPWSPYFNPGTRRVRAVSIEGAIPQAYINGDQAADACAEAGKRLCTDTEWLRACQGSAGNTFPYGDARQDGVCNDSYSGHPAVDYFGTNDDSIWSMLDNACIGQQDGTVDRSASNAGCASQDGIFDMMGNLHEWTADPSGTFRGGFYADTERNGPGCLYRTTAHNTGHWDYSTGFRCCAD